MLKASSVDVRNVFYNYVATADYTFTTRLGAFFGSFAFRMINPSSQAMPPTTDDTMANSPNEDALVYVHHCPKSTSGVGTCPALAHETWYVYPNLTSPPYAQGTPPYVGTAIVTIGSGKNAYDVNGGQFSMPFYFAISMLN
jgi:hypothetical protein